MVKVTTQDVVKLLNKLGAPRSNSGYRYMVEALTLVSKDESYLQHVTSLYKEVATIVNNTWHNVERSIRYEIEFIFDQGNEEVFTEVFGTYRKNDKLTNKEFLTSIYYYLIYLQEEEHTND